MSNPLIHDTRATATGTAAIGIRVHDSADIHNTSARGDSSDITLQAAARLYADNIDYYTSTIGAGATLEALASDRSAWDTTAYYNRHASDISASAFTYHNDPLNPPIHVGDAAGGDLTGTYPNPSLENTGPGATGPIGSATVAPVITIDAQGRVTALSSAAISGGSPGGSAGGDLTGTYPNPTLATVNANVGSFTSANITVNAKGLITAASNGIGGAVNVYNETQTANGVNTIYYLVNYASPGTIRVYIDGIRQPASDDVAATDVVSFSVAPSLNALLMFDYEMDIA